MGVGDFLRWRDSSMFSEAAQSGGIHGRVGRDANRSREPIVTHHGRASQPSATWHSPREQP